MKMNESGKLIISRKMMSNVRPEPELTCGARVSGARPNKTIDRWQQEAAYVGRSVCVCESSNIVKYRMNLTLTLEFDVFSDYSF